MHASEAANRKFQKELNAGAIGLVLLSVLGRARRPLYGYQIAKSLESDEDHTSMVKQGSLYPVLRSLEGAGLLVSEVEASLAGPPRRYYRITDSGRHTLAQWTLIWQRSKRFVDAVLEGDVDVTDD
jgi:PadR family transcriptional regulator PadR